MSKLTINYKSLVSAETRETVVTGLEMFNKNLMKRMLGKTLVFFFAVLRKETSSAEWFLQLQEHAHLTQSSKERSTF